MVYGERIGGKFSLAYAIFTATVGTLFDELSLLLGEAKFRHTPSRQGQG